MKYGRSIAVITFVLSAWVILNLAFKTARPVSRTGDLVDRTFQVTPRIQMRFTMSPYSNGYVKTIRTLVDGTVSEQTWFGPDAEFLSLMDDFKGEK
jgi:hypothetical protein